jgi:hypothetical protein
MLQQHPGEPAVGPTTWAVTMSLVAKDDSLAAVIALLLRKRWSILELQHRRTSTHDSVRLVTTKVHGDIELLLTALNREVLVIDAARQ